MSRGTEKNYNPRQDNWSLGQASNPGSIECKVGATAARICTSKMFTSFNGA